MYRFIKGENLTHLFHVKTMMEEKTEQQGKTFNRIEKIPRK